MRVFLYAGQGSQFAGMGKDLYDNYPVYRKTADEADTGFDHITLMHEGPEEMLTQTEYTQGCMAVFAAGVTNILREKGIVPDASAGLSLGEYGALYAAGVWDEQTYIKTVSFRGRAMAEAAKGKKVSMIAVTGIDAAAAEEICGNIRGKGFIGVSNYNCPGQYVICGEEAAAEEAEKLAADKYRARCIKLKTSGPFHTPLLEAAGISLCNYFEDIVMNEPAIPVALNVTGKLYEKGMSLKDMLVRQVQSPVRFEDVLKTLIEAGGTDFIEIGPGKVLTGLLRKTARTMNVKVNAVSVTSSEDIEKL